MSERAPRWLRAIAVIAVAVPILACGELSIVNSTQQGANVIVALNDRGSSSVRTLKPGESTGMSTDDNTRYAVVVLAQADVRELEQTMDEMLQIWTKTNAKDIRLSDAERKVLKQRYDELKTQIGAIRKRSGAISCTGKVPEGGNSFATISIDSDTGKFDIGCRDEAPKQTQGG